MQSNIIFSVAVALLIVVSVANSANAACSDYDSCIDCYTNGAGSGSNGSSCYWCNDTCLDVPVDNSTAEEAGNCAEASLTSCLNCIVATAAYGTPLNDEINALRRFRDNVARYVPGGKSLVELYYKVSPPLAHSIVGNSAARAAVRAVITPIVFTIQNPALTFSAVAILATVLLNRKN